MKCLYINLDESAARRAALEANVRALAPDGWTLARIPALGPGEGAVLAGARSDAEKACLLSHRAALTASLDEDGPVLIVEDDTWFGVRSFEVIGRMAAAPDADWDLLFTDLTLLDAGHRAQFARQWKRLAAAGQYLLADLAKLPFAATSGYVVRGDAKQRLAEALAALPTVDLPYDIQLYEFIRSGRFRARVAFPFLTTLAPEADASMIQPERWRLHNDTLNAFRRLMFVERDLAALEPQVARLEAACDLADQLYGRLAAVTVSDAFPERWS